MFEKVVDSERVLLNFHIMPFTKLAIKTLLVIFQHNFELLALIFLP